MVEAVVKATASKLTCSALAMPSFTQMGCDVLIPITESASYDIVIDTSEGLKRVQVKYSSDRKVDLRNIHSNSNGYVIKKAKQNSYDWLYVLFEIDGDFEEHLFKECFVDRRSVSLSSFSKFIFGEVA